MFMSSLSSASRFAPPPTQARPALQAVSASPSVHNTQRTGALLDPNFKLDQYTNDLTYLLCTEAFQDCVSPNLNLRMLTDESFTTRLGRLIREAVNPLTSRYVRSIQRIQKGTPNSLLLGQDQNSVILATHELPLYGFERLKYERCLPQSSLAQAPCFNGDKRIITFSLPIPSTVGDPQLFWGTNQKTNQKIQQLVPPLLQTLLDNREEVANAEGRFRTLLAKMIRQHLKTPIIDAKKMNTLLTDAGQLEGLEKQARAIEVNIQGMSDQFGRKPQGVQASN
jgi:hypothetical protein